MLDLRSGVRAALQILDQASAGQDIIQIGVDAVEVDWSPRRYHHHTLALPLALLTAAADVGAARARWSGLRLASAMDTARLLDGPQKDMMLALADGAAPKIIERFGWRWGSFAAELAEWIERFDLAGEVLTLDRARLLSGARDAHYTVRPVQLMDKMAPVLRTLPRARLAAAVVVLGLYEGAGAMRMLKRRPLLNPPIIDAIEDLRGHAGEDGYANFLRLIAAYRGW